VRGVKNSCLPTTSALASEIGYIAPNLRVSMIGEFPEVGGYHVSMGK
jgi:hypothetical protein